MPGRLEQFRLARLVRRAERGDKRAFSSLFAALHPTVYGYMAARVRVRADAEDLTADAMHRFVRQLRRYDAARGGVRAWAMTIARNTLIDFLRRSHRTEVASLHDMEHLMADVRFAPDHRHVDPRLEDVAQALATFPPKTREMFALRYGEGLTIAEIAAVLDMSEAAAKQRFSRTLRTLKLKLDPPSAQSKGVERMPRGSDDNHPTRSSGSNTSTREASSEVCDSTSSPFNSTASNTDEEEVAHASS